MSATITGVKNYFAQKASAYDDVENQIYWVLSDKLLWHFFKTEVLNNLPENFTFLDAGGGTGRWTKKILDEFPSATGCIVDLSTDMLGEARKKFDKPEYAGRIQLIEGNIENLDLETDSFDVSFNFHNVLGFVQNPDVALGELYRVTKSEGYVVSLVPNLYHNLFFNISVGNFKYVETAMQEQKSKFTDNMPFMHMYTPCKIAEMYDDAGLFVERVSGFPNVIYPGYAETQLHGSTEVLEDILENKEIFDKIFEVEKELFYEDDIAARGNNIFIIGRV